MTQENKEKLTEDQPIQLRPIGTSKGFTVPSEWLKVFKGLTRDPLFFYAHVEKDQDGNIYLVLKKAKNPTIPPPK